MKLTKKFIEDTRKIKTPFLMVDLDIIKSNYHRIKKSINNVELFYAVKSNDNVKILDALKKEGSSFDVASLYELNTLLKLGVPPEKIICFHTIKSPEFLVALKKHNIEIMSYDSYDEVDKIAQYAPNSKVVLRIIVDNEGSDWPLTKKFGVAAAEAIDYLKYAREKGLNPIGITFHVGSQCHNKHNWTSALYVCADIWEQARKEGMNLTFLSLGGGLPVKHIKPIPSIEEIGTSINTILQKRFINKYKDLKVTIEPGRGLVGDAGIMVTSIVGKAKRDQENWVYTDAGVFNALMETIEGFMYEIKAEKNRKKILTTIGGPSCDSVDITFKDVMIPEVKLGEKLYILNSCAYTTVYASAFNGFDPLKVYFK
jgi:ornithine decarboxylase